MKISTLVACSLLLHVAAIVVAAVLGNIDMDGLDVLLICALVPTAIAGTVAAVATPGEDSRFHVVRGARGDSDSGGQYRRAG